VSQPLPKHALGVGWLSAHLLREHFLTVAHGGVISSQASSSVDPHPRPLPARGRGAHRLRRNGICNRPASPPSEFARVLAAMMRPSESPHYTVRTASARRFRPSRSGP
jgi:hypothetical protein